MKAYMETRTRKMPEKFPYTNRLLKEKSPYLLQHAHNPVEWYSWGKEAFDAAKDSDKPIFLSIGYATCHWCHVMEKESFENLGVAELLNETFINIKVDREELPQIDSLYMEFAQSLMTGSAGWPLNVILTPDLKPFFASTYLPPHSTNGLMGLTDLITKIHELWQSDDREEVLQQADKIVEVYKQNLRIDGEHLPEREQIEEAADLLFKMADPVHGGMKGAPKFPIGYQANFLLRYSKTMKDSRALFIVERTLDMIHRGGIYDHLGGGFSRYSVDEAWLVPHFEKMLYDNALLVDAYVEAWLITHKPLYRQVTKEILGYVLREMTHSEGGFYSAEDADSEGHEGQFYTWTYEEIHNILGPSTAKLFCEFYHVTPEGNFEGRNILHTKETLEEFAKNKHLEQDQLTLLLSQQRHLLWQVREKREHPFKDDKILSSWNGLMIHSMIEAGNAFNEKEFVDAALKAARFIKQYAWQEGSLLRRWRDGEALYDAGLDEYAFMIKAVLSLYEANKGTDWLQWAMQMTNILSNNFKAENGGFYQTDGKDPDLILRKMQFSDGAEPSGNAVHCENLLRLYQLTGDETYLTYAEDVLRAVEDYMTNYSPGYTYHMMNLNRYYAKESPTIVISLNAKNGHAEELNHAIFSRYIPYKAVIWRSVDDKEILKIIPYVEHYVPIDEKTTLYVCYRGVCKRPTNDIKEMLAMLDKL